MTRDEAWVAAYCAALKAVTGTDATEGFIGDYVTIAVDAADHLLIEWDKRFTCGKKRNMLPSPQTRTRANPRKRINAR